MSPNDDDAFGSKTLKLMMRACDSAKRRLQESTAPEEQEALAKWIVDASKAGERNISRLFAAALSGLRRSR
jgi:hypothetical protein